MNVVIDTNVLVSGLLSPKGPCGHILTEVLDGRLRLCVDQRMLNEYHEVVRRPRLGISPEDFGAVMAVIPTGPPPKQLSLALPDPDDLPLLEVAAADGAVLVTGNLKHFPARSRAGVTVLTPAQFVELLRRV